MRRTLRWVDLVLAGLLLVLGAGVAQAQKTDSVWIKNGDRITGEVKGLSKALLEYSTDDLGTIYIEWDKVDRISSPSTFEVTLSSGRKLYGPLGLSSTGRVIMGMEAIPLLDIVTLVPIKRTFFERLERVSGSGLLLPKIASDRAAHFGGQSGLPGAEVRDHRRILHLPRGSGRCRQDVAPLGQPHRAVVVQDRWSAGAVLGYERNQELDLAGRTRIVGFGARTMAQTNHLDFWVTAGLVATVERYFSTDTTTKSVEGLVGVVFHAFSTTTRNSMPPLSARSFPVFPISGRVRLQNDIRLSHELVKDFMLTGTVFDTYDSKPPAVAAEKRLRNHAGHQLDVLIVTRVAPEGAGSWEFTLS